MHLEAQQRLQEEGCVVDITDPREADPSRRPREVGPASSAPEAGRTTPDDSRGRPSVLHLGLHNRSLDRCAWGDDQGARRGWP